MRYWFFDERSKKATGPHLDMVLSRLPGFGPDAKVATEGSGPAGAWKPVREVPELAAFLPAPPPRKKK